MGHTKNLTRHSKGRYDESATLFRQGGSRETDRLWNKHVIINPDGTIASSYLYSAMYYDNNLICCREGWKTLRQVDFYYLLLGR